MAQNTAEEPGKGGAPEWPQDHGRLGGVGVAVIAASREEDAGL